MKLTDVRPIDYKESVCGHCGGKVKALDIICPYCRYHFHNRMTLVYKDTIYNKEEDKYV